MDVFEFAAGVVLFDLDVFGAGWGPDEADTPLLVDADPGQAETVADMPRIGSQAGILAQVPAYAARRRALVRVELQGWPRLAGTGSMQDRLSSP